MVQTNRTKRLLERRSYDQGRPALSELRDHKGRARRVRSVPRGPGPLLLHESQPGSLARWADMFPMWSAVRGTARRATTAATRARANTGTPAASEPYAWA